MPEIFALIPVYNEEENISEVVSFTRGYVSKVVICDDGSVDNTLDVIRGLDVVVIEHGDNRGYGSSLRSLFAKSVELGADVVVTIDGDGQHDPSYIPSLVSLILDGGADLVIGSRFLEEEREQAPLVKRFGVWLLNILIGLGSKLWITDSQSGYRAYKTSIFSHIALKEEGMGISTEILLKARKEDFRVVEVPVQIRRYDKVVLFSLLHHGFTVFRATLRNL
jgi:glycosyltransferase involved in cell wall biosynthesis